MHKTNRVFFMKKSKVNLPFILFIFSLCFLSFILGAVLVRFNVFGSSESDAISRRLTNATERPGPHHLFPIRYPDSGVKVHNRDKVCPGVTLLTSYWKNRDWSAGIRLIDRDGNTLHHWEIKAKELWPVSPYDDYVTGTKNTNGNYVHGTFLYPNGDIVFNIEYLGLFRMNSSGKVLWKLKYRTHHSVFRDEDGNFWVPGCKFVNKNSERRHDFPFMRPVFTEETILKVSPEGKILKEISVLESVVKSEFQHLLWHYDRLTGDVHHLNDIQVLGSDMADSFPLFDPGDLLISSRHLHFVAVLDPDGRIKWALPGIFTFQHDPDFESDGWITVFDNRSGLGQSLIRAIKPDDGRINTLYPVSLEQQFYTITGGKHQKLKNGNRLITEATAGRVFEITPRGETVWEWINTPYSEKLVPEVLEGTRYDLDKKTIENW